MVCGLLGRLSWRDVSDLRRPFNHMAGMSGAAMRAIAGVQVCWYANNQRMQAFGEKMPCRCLSIDAVCSVAPLRPA